MEEKLYPYDSRQIANWFIRRANHDKQSMSIMRVLKLVYMAHGWTLATFQRPLILDRIEAWDYGPVIPAIYYAFRPQGIHDISPLYMYERNIEPKINKLLDEVHALYKEIPTLKLSNITHVAGGPWDRVYGQGNRFREIPDDLIGHHYKAKLERTENG